MGAPSNGGTFKHNGPPSNEQPRTIADVTHNHHPQPLEERNVCRKNRTSQDPDAPRECNDTADRGKGATAHHRRRDTRPSPATFTYQHILLRRPLPATYHLAHMPTTSYNKDAHNTTSHECALLQKTYATTNARYCKHMQPIE